MWNHTTLRTCTGGIRPEKMCIIGGGSSGVHMGWLLKRRGFEKSSKSKKSRREKKKRSFEFMSFSRYVTFHVVFVVRQIAYVVFVVRLSTDIISKMKVRP